MTGANCDLFTHKSSRSYLNHLVPKRDKATGEWRRLYALYSSLNIIRVIKSRRLIWECKPERRRPLVKPRLRWEDNIKMDLRKVGWRRMDWMDLAHDMDRRLAVMNAVMNLQVP
jgi:hypothetical protein